MSAMKQILPLLPQCYGEKMREADFEGLEELRLAVGQPMLLRVGASEQIFWPRTTQSQLEELIRRACRQSLYAHQETLKQGFVTIEGGHRIGICAAAVMDNGSVENFRAPSSAVIRVAREVIGFADALLPKCSGSMLILGPPGSGKTTLLRDLIRQLSDHCKQRVAVADERAELSAWVDGRSQMELGCRTDVMRYAPKSQAVMMLLRTMHPQWIAMDEVTAPGDIEALEQASYCGVRLLATAHGSSMEDLKKRRLYRNLMEAGIFERVVLLRADKRYTVEEVAF